MSNEYFTKLNQFIKESRYRRFEFGTNDCCMFAANAVKAMTDIDIAKDYRGTYETESEYLELISESGFSTLNEFISSLLINEKARINASRGDIALFDNSGTETVGIIYGGSIVSPGQFGLMNIPLSAVIKLWDFKQWQ